MNKIVHACYLASKYQMISEATLRSDMAKRIMYSLLPALSDESHIYMTGGVVDYKALASAIEGRHDIIKYGIRACVKEMRHYDGTGDESIRNAINGAINNNDYEKALRICKETFEDEFGWGSEYGGEAWAKIADTLLKLVNLDKNLSKLRNESRNSPDFYEQEIEIMKQIIINLNVFDGLSHNTDSIMRNLVKEEVKDLYQGKAGMEVTNFDAIENLMDSKEFKDPANVFSVIEPELIGSGDIHRYKDWTNKLRTQKSYRSNDESGQKEKYIVRLRKKILYLLEVIPRDLRDINTIISEINSADKDDFSILKASLEQFFKFLKSHCENLFYHASYLANDFARQNMGSKIILDMSNHIKNTSKSVEERDFVLKNKMEAELKHHREEITSQELIKEKKIFFEIATSLKELYEKLYIYMEQI